MAFPRISLALAAASLLLVGAGCGARRVAPGPSANAAPDTAPQAAAPEVPAVNAAPEVPQFAQCTLAATSAVTLYMRADAKADVFGTLGEGEAVVLGGRTDDGWYGFDPAAAQAPNVGPFRLRWVKPGSSYTLAGGCDKLAVYPRVPPGVCFVMTQTDTPVRDTPAADAKEVSKMHDGDYAMAIGRKGPSRAPWIKIDAGSGSLHGTGTGWASMETLDFNGPCERLPAAK